jgi:hypothetical protein
MSRRRQFFVALVFIVLAGAPVRGKITGSDDPKAFTEHDLVKAELAFNQRTMSEAYKQAGKRDPKWDGAAIEFLDAMAVSLTNYDRNEMYRLKEQKTTEQLKKLAAAAVDAGCADPMVVYYKLVLEDHAGRPPAAIAPAIEQAANDMSAAHYPVFRAAMAMHRACKLRENDGGGGDPVARAKSWDKFNDLAVALVTFWDYKDIDQRIILRALWTFLNADGIEKQKAFVESLAAQEKVDPWMKAMFLGRHEIKLAWESRGSGWGNTVTEEGARGFYDHLKKAQNHLMAAQKLRPQFPEAACDMITVAMGGGDAFKLNERTWFDKATAAQLDYGEAYHTYLYAMLPRWHGSYDIMYSFGLECLQAKRFDTNVPWQFMDAMQDILSDDGPEYWQRPAVYGHVDELMSGMAKQYPAKADYFRSYQAACAWRCGKYDDARKVMDDLGDRMKLRAFGGFGVMPPVAASHAYAMRPGVQEKVEAAEAQATSGDLSAAAKAYADVSEKIDAKDRAQLFLRGRRQQLLWLFQLRAGQWVDIQPTDKDLIGWAPQAGTWSVDDKGGLVGTADADDNAAGDPGGIWMPCQTMMQDNFAIEGTLELHANGGTMDAGIGVLLSDLRTRYGIYLRDAEGRGSLLDYCFPFKDFPLELQPSNKFRFTFNAGTVTAEVNGKKICENVPTQIWNAGGGSTYLAVGCYTSSKGQSVRYTGLRMRSTRAAAVE